MNFLPNCSMFLNTLVLEIVRFKKSRVVVLPSAYDVIWFVRCDVSLAARIGIASPLNPKSLLKKIGNATHAMPTLWMPPIAWRMVRWSELLEERLESRPQPRHCVLRECLCARRAWWRGRKVGIVVDWRDGSFVVVWRGNEGKFWLKVGISFALVQCWTGFVCFCVARRLGALLQHELCTRHSVVV